MIRICKNADKPQTLDKSYNTDEVCKQLLMDQNDKCYLWERHLTTPAGRLPSRTFQVAS